MDIIVRGLCILSMDKRMDELVEGLHEELHIPTWDLLFPWPWWCMPTDITSTRKVLLTTAIHGIL